MKKHSLSDFKGGWFLGDFAPSLLGTKDFEISVKYYHAGESEDAHYHKIATEWTVITEGEVEMNGARYYRGDILEVSPGEIVRFSAITEAATTVVKVPSVNGDKYVVG